MAGGGFRGRESLGRGGRRGKQAVARLGGHLPEKLLQALDLALVRDLLLFRILDEFKDGLHVLESLLQRVHDALHLKHRLLDRARRSRAVGQGLHASRDRPVIGFPRVGAAGFLAAPGLARFVLFRAFLVVGRFLRIPLRLAGGIVVGEIGWRLVLAGILEIIGIVRVATFGALRIADLLGFLGRERGVLDGIPGRGRDRRHGGGCAATKAPGGFLDRRGGRRGVVVSRGDGRGRTLDYTRGLLDGGWDRDGFSGRCVVGGDLRFREAVLGAEGASAGALTQRGTAGGTGGRGLGF